MHSCDTAITVKWHKDLVNKVSIFNHHSRWPRIRVATSYKKKQHITTYHPFDTWQIKYIWTKHMQPYLNKITSVRLFGTKGLQSMASMSTKCCNYDGRDIEIIKKWAYSDGCEDDIFSISYNVVIFHHSKHVKQVPLNENSLFNKTLYRQRLGLSNPKLFCWFSSVYKHCLLYVADHFTYQG